MKKAGNSQIMRTITLLITIFSLSFPAYCKVIYVDDDAVGANIGSSWMNAYTFLQDALADANSAPKPVEVRIAQGVYKPDLGDGQSHGNREATFQLINGVNLRGGYAGLGGSNPNERDINTFESILSGDLNGNDADVNSPFDLIEDATCAENCYHVLTAHEVDETAVLNGLTITRGNGIRHTWEDSWDGGGMYNVNSSPSLIYCTFKRNSGRYGGGIYNYKSNPILSDCTFIGNASRSGGGICNGDHSNPSITNCKFMGNESGDGGGLCNYDYSRPTITNCNFTGNMGGGGGGLCNKGNSKPIITNCTFTGNTGVNGGGMYNGACIPKLTHCNFNRNSAEDGGGIYNRNTFGTSRAGFPCFVECSFVGNIANLGGGMYNWYKSNPNLINCSFVENSASNGGGIYNNDCSPDLKNCIFTGNLADRQAGGMYNFRSNPSLKNCIFSGNKAVLYGGGMDNYKSTLTITNCTFVGNLAQNGNALAFVFPQSIAASKVELSSSILWDGGNEIWNNGGSNINITYSNIEGGQDSIYDPCEVLIWGEGNIDNDPLFVDPGYWDPNGTPEYLNDDFWLEGDYHLKTEVGRWDSLIQSWVIDDATSPCIDAGNPNNSVSFEPFPNGGIINMGTFGGTVQASKSPSGLHTKYSGGTGEPNDPYKIAIAEDLVLLGGSPKDFDKHFIMIADIGLSCHTFDRAVIAPDMNDLEDNYQGTPFTGCFDGQGHVIRHLNIQGRMYLGLFGQLDVGAVVADLGLDSVDISGIALYYIGGLVGYNNGGSIMSCNSTGAISGHSLVGGLVGDNREGSVLSSYSTVTVNGGSKAGGLVGRNYYGTITSSYSTGTVTGESSYIGGLVGENWAGTIWGNYSTGTVSGEDYVGGLVGSNEYGSISLCYGAGTVTGEDYYIGGLVGDNSYGKIWCSYSTGPVNGIEEVGGLVGGNYHGSITNCYSTGTVSGTEEIGGFVGGNPSGSISLSYSTGMVTGDNFTGGLVGWNGDTRPGFGDISSSFWDTQVSGLTHSDGGTGLTTTQMQDINTYMEAGWDFGGESANGTCNIWILQNEVYPTLAVFSGKIPAAPYGAGTREDPYLITDANELGSIYCRPIAHYRLATDIDLSDMTWSTAVVPWFGGSFDGNGFCIQSLQIQGADHLGLFGILVSGAQVMNLGLDNVSIDGTSDYVGSLVGSNKYGDISSCYSTGTISGILEVGGLVGSNEYGSISDSYCSGTVTGDNFIGGLVGRNFGSIWSNYSTCMVSKEGGFIGGLIGQSSRSVVSSFWDIQTSGLTYSDGGIGLSTIEMKDINTYLNAGWDFVSETANGTEDIWWILEGQDYPRLWWESLE